MAQTVPTASPGSVSFTYNAPYSQYLRALSDEWDQAASLEKTLQEAREELDVLRASSKKREPLDSENNACFAAIVDVCPGQSGNNVVVVAAELDKDQIQGEHRGTVNMGAVDGFVDSLRHCATNVHTRMIVLQDAALQQSEDDDSIQALLNSHLLGFELGLTPAYVCHLSQWGNPQRLSHMRRYPSLEFNMRRGNSRSGHIALYLGRKSFGGSSPYTSECMCSSRRTMLKLTCSHFVVVLSLQDSVYDVKASGKGFREPPSPAEWNTVRSPISTPRPMWRSMDRFIAAVKSSVHASSPLELSTPSGCWLSALIEEQVVCTAWVRDMFDTEREPSAAVFWAILNSGVRPTFHHENSRTYSRHSPV
jgi:hypothetical protein